MHILKIYKTKKNFQYLVAASLVFVLAISLSCILEFKNTYSYPENGEKLMGVNMKGKYTSLNYERFPNVTIMNSYYDDSFKLIKSMGLNHVR